jgi:NAD(P)-dependent dehydrogenase (short-subunit alcohol dehydrogenase family)|tara:strand:+ start:7190 stop:8098 length:909 start_codon:yes stop_codon:yes gene_type:complete
MNTTFLINLFILFKAVSTFALRRKVAIVTGGTRGIGKGISESLAKREYDLLLSYNSDYESAIDTCKFLEKKYNCRVELFSGDISLKSTRKKMFKFYDLKFKNTHNLGVVVHNAGQYVGITSGNSEGLKKPLNNLAFGDGSLINNDELDISIMKFYQKMYGDAYIDICERSIPRMKKGGSLIGISSPGCTTQFNPSPGYDMPGSGKCIMEYAMRLFALRCAPLDINCNIVIPGFTKTDAWDRMGDLYETTGDSMVEKMAEKYSPNGSMTTEEVGEGIYLLCSPEGRHITGISLPIDKGVHLKL